ncbi:glycoside hydrolase domain-containing protein [Rhodoferax ferrireducens]|uniref:glycoside hydrolase domain-containing protein n=1 Tax=Rhodoferax ferrireducens TaxID=192843 RepID=UPI003BB7DE52
MLEGISTNRLCDSSATGLVAAGKAFVIRYYSRTTKQPEKQLRPKEAAEMARAGLQIAVVYQDRARLTQDFNLARGQLDGASAFASAGQIGQPAGSAIYFAVDVDFSAAQIKKFVLPYFKGVRAALDAASGGVSHYKLGVYGSGLTCRLLKKAGLVEFTWLAEATGWAESKTYTAWDVKQFVTNQDLCSIGNGWQRCTALPAFGQFQPAGFEVQAGEGELMKVSATQLNLRFVPTADANTPLATLPHGTLLRVLGVSAPGWVRVRVTLNGATFIGHVKASFLEAAPGLPPAPAPNPQIAAVHWKEDNRSATRQSTGGLASPIGEAGRPTRDPNAVAALRKQQLAAIGDWLDVEHSTRYAGRDGVTFCNVYAADYCYLAAAYLPRVWWTSPAIARMAAGQAVAAAYADTVREMRADDLYRWLLDYGAMFGWRRVADATALQSTANGGGIGIICADRAAEGRPGHITVVVPEDTGNTAQHDAAGNVDQPLQSQAGAVNKRFGNAGRNWWLGAAFIDHVFFVHA